MKRIRKRGELAAFETRLTSALEARVIEDALDAGPPTSAESAQLARMAAHARAHPYRVDAGAPDERAELEWAHTARRADWRARAKIVGATLAASVAVVAVWRGLASSSDSAATPRDLASETYLSGDRAPGKPLTVFQGEVTWAANDRGGVVRVRVFEDDANPDSAEPLLETYVPGTSWTPEAALRRPFLVVVDQLNVDGTDYEELARGRCTQP